MSSLPNIGGKTGDTIKYWKRTTAHRNWPRIQNNQSCLLGACDDALFKHKKGHI